jgi:hypothetical protein
MGPQGPEGPSGIVAAMAANGTTGQPPATLNFVGNVATVTLTAATQRILIQAQGVFGTTSATGASQLNVGVCWKQITGFNVLPAAQLRGLSIPAPGRSAYSVTGIVSPGVAASYHVGLCAATVTPSAWNDNGENSVTALVLR